MSPVATSLALVDTAVNEAVTGPGRFAVNVSPTSTVPPMVMVLIWAMLGVPITPVIVLVVVIFVAAFVRVRFVALVSVPEVRKVTLDPETEAVRAPWAASVRFVRLARFAAIVRFVAPPLFLIYAPPVQSNSVTHPLLILTTHVPTVSVPLGIAERFIVLEAFTSVPTTFA